MKSKEKLRRWLIKKLGGDTIDALAAEPRYVTKYTKTPIKIRIDYLTPKHTLEVIPMPIEYVRERLAAEMANVIVEQHLYTERRESGYEPGSEHIEWTLEIIPPGRMEDE